MFASAFQTSLHPHWQANCQPMFNKNKRKRKCLCPSYSVLIWKYPDLVAYLTPLKGLYLTLVISIASTVKPERVDPCSWKLTSKVPEDAWFAGKPFLFAAAAAPPLPLPLDGEGEAIADESELPRMMLPLRHAGLSLATLPMRQMASCF